MYGGFSDESLTEFIKLTYGDDAENFSEEDIFSFTRCVRPNGSTYGTAGKCKKGTETGAKEVTPSSSRTRPKAAIESDMLKLTSSGAMQQAGLAGIKARAEHAALKAELKKPLKDNVIGNPTPAQRAAMENKIALTRNKTKSPADLVTPQKQGKADADRIRKYASDEAAKLKALNDAQKQNSNNANDPAVASRKKILERNVAAAEKQLKELEEKSLSESRKIMRQNREQMDILSKKMSELQNAGKKVPESLQDQFDKAKSVFNSRRNAINKATGVMKSPVMEEARELGRAAEKKNQEKRAAQKGMDTLISGSMGK